MLANAVRSDRMRSQIDSELVVAPAGRSEHLLSLPYLTVHSSLLVKEWLNAAGHNMLPRKRDILPERLGRALAYIIIYEYQSRDCIRFRLAGTAFRKLHGVDPKGANYLDLSKPEDRSKTAERLFGMIEHPCGLYSSNSTRLESGRTGAYRTFALPMTDDDGRPVFSIQVSEFTGETRIGETASTTRLSADAATYFDIGAGLPDFEPPR